MKKTPKEKLAKLIDNCPLVSIKRIPSKSPPFKVVSLFSGCGGLDLGFMGGFDIFGNEQQLHFATNPFKIVWANDHYTDAVNTYKRNLGDHITSDDIQLVDHGDIPSCDVVIGGFPCQDFSISGLLAGLKSERGRLYQQMLRIVKAKSPMAFVAENVKNLINDKIHDHIRNQPAIVTIAEDFAKLGYRIKVRNLHAPDYGIPQKRDRVFIVGIRNDIKKEFFYPKPHHPRMNAKQAIDDLWGKEADPSIFNHSQRSEARFKPPSRNGNQGNYKLKPDKPSYVMRAEHHMNIQAHYRTLRETEPENRAYWRRLTVREAARIQTFPDDFFFTGNKSHSYRQVGNAVPPMLGWYVARALAQVIA